MRTETAGRSGVGTAGREAILACLPARLRTEVAAVLRERTAEELRLRRGGGGCLLCGGEVIPLRASLSVSEMDGILNALCGGSMYAYQDTLREGYVTVGGIRVGVCGRWRSDGGRMLGICDISSLVFRFPRDIPLSVEAVCRLLTVTHPGRGVLIYSPPGVGKTTLLRSLIRALAEAPYRLRLAVVDTREELFAPLPEADRYAEWLLGYPRAEGIEIATRTLNPQMIVCDEIGGVREAEAICAACHAGVPLIATAHAADVGDVRARAGLRLLAESGVFGSYVGLSRRADGELIRSVTLHRA